MLFCAHLSKEGCAANDQNSGGAYLLMPGRTPRMAPVQNFGRHVSLPGISKLNVNPSSSLALLCIGHEFDPHQSDTGVVHRELS